MPNVFKSGEYVPDIEGKVTGATTIIIHSVEELKALRALCDLAPRPPGLPLGQVRQALETEITDLALWAQWSQRTSAPVGASLLEDWQGSTAKVIAPEDEEPDALDEAIEPYDSLRSSLDLATSLWEQVESSERQLIAVAVAIAGDNPRAELRVEGDEAALVFSHGSLVARLVSAPFPPLASR